MAGCMAQKEKIAVILAAHGEAETAGFMENYRVTRQTLAHASQIMPIPVSLQRFIAVSSSVKKRFRARSGWQGSPHNQHTREQANALQLDLDASQLAERFRFEVHAAFSVAPPFVEQLIEATRSSFAQVIVSMSPVDNTLTCGQLCAYLASSREPGELRSVKVLSRFWQDERLLSVYCDHLFAHTPPRAGVGREQRILLLLFHGTLVADAKGQAPRFRNGLEESRSFASRLQRTIAADPRNPYGRIMTAYLNHEVGGEWSQPSFEAVCTMLQQERAARVELFGCGYFADGNETIGRAGELMLAAPVKEALSIPCINSSPAFSRYLASRVSDAAEQMMSWI